MLASVLNDPKLGKGPSWFINKNTKDFDDEDIIELLRSKSCQFKGSFQGGLHLIRQALDSTTK